MIKTGFLLCSQDNTYRSEPIVTTIGFSTNRSELETELEILEKDYSAKLKVFKEQSRNCDNYIKKFDKAWNKYETKNVIPYYTHGIQQPVEKPKTEEEHAEYKRIKDLNYQNFEKDLSFCHREKCKFLSEWVITNPPHDSFRKFIETIDDGSDIVSSNVKNNTSYFICEIGKEVSEEF